MPAREPLCRTFALRQDPTRHDRPAIRQSHCSREILEPGSHLPAAPESIGAARMSSAERIQVRPGRLSLAETIANRQRRSSHCVTCRMRMQGKNGSYPPYIDVLDFFSKKEAFHGSSVQIGNCETPCTPMPIAAQSGQRVQCFDAADNLSERRCNRCSTPGPAACSRQND